MDIESSQWFASDHLHFLLRLVHKLITIKADQTGHSDRAPG